jgi:uncharacterized protein YlzI (FlbEa/FlbD family)
MPSRFTTNSHWITTMRTTADVVVTGLTSNVNAPDIHFQQPLHSPKSKASLSATLTYSILPSRFTTNSHWITTMRTTADVVITGLVSNVNAPGFSFCKCLQQVGTASHAAKALDKGLRHITLSQVCQREYSRGAMCVQSVDVRVLQFTRRRAVCCVLHRPTSRVGRCERSPRFPALFCCHIRCKSFLDSIRRHPVA